jgi:hypothetical protein
MQYLAISWDVVGGADCEKEIKMLKIVMEEKCCGSRVLGREEERIHLLPRGHRRIVRNCKNRNICRSWNYIDVTSQKTGNYIRRDKSFQLQIFCCHSYMHFSRPTSAFSFFSGTTMCRSHPNVLLVIITRWIYMLARHMSGSHIDISYCSLYFKI